MVALAAAPSEISEQHFGVGPPRYQTSDRPSGGFWTARRTLAGFEAMAMIRKGQVSKSDGRDMRTQAAFIGELFGVAA